MIKDKYIEPFLTKEGQRDIMFTNRLSSELIIKYLKNLSDEEIAKLGNALAWLYPKDILTAFIRNDKSNKYYGFVNDFRREYNISNRFTMEDKHAGIKLVNEIKQQKSCS